MKVTIDQSGCISCGLCADTCPEVFRLAEDDIAEVYGEITDENKDSAVEAAESCPVTVIMIQ